MEVACYTRCNLRNIAYEVPNVAMANTNQVEVIQYKSSTMKFWPYRFINWSLFVFFVSPNREKDNWEKKDLLLFLLLTLYCCSVPKYANYQHCVYSISLMILREFFGSRFRDFKGAIKSVHLGTTLQRNSVFKMVEYINIEVKM